MAAPTVATFKTGNSALGAVCIKIANASSAETKYWIDLGFIPKEVIIVGDLATDAFHYWNEAMPDASVMTITTAAAYATTNGITPKNAAAVTTSEYIIRDEESGNYVASAAGSDDYCTGVYLGSGVVGGNSETIYVTCRR